MRLVLAVCLSMLGAGAAVPAVGQTRADLERCRAIGDDMQRLACYDAIDSGPATRSKYDVVPLAELMDFALSYRGDLIETSGWIEPGNGNLFRLRPEGGHEDSLPVDVESLSRRDRQAFLDRCGEGCEATVQGRVGPVNFTTGIVADILIAH